MLVEKKQQHRYCHICNAIVSPLILGYEYSWLLGALTARHMPNMAIYIYINMNKIICLCCALEEFQRSISINNTFDPTIFDMNHWAELVEWKWETYLMEGLTFFPSSASFEEHILLLHTFLHKNITICFFEYFFSCTICECRWVGWIHENSKA